MESGAATTEWMTVRQASKVLRRSVYTIHRLVKAGTLEVAYRTPGSNMIFLDAGSVRRLVEQMGRNSGETDNDDDRCPWCGHPTGTSDELS